VNTDLILLDVKAGSGAFMKTPEDAGNLARACVELATGWGRAARAAVTDMSQPLGEAVGNALDVAEVVELMAGKRGGRLRDLAVEFAAEALASLGHADHDAARDRALAALEDGSALEAFRRMVEAQGGDPRVCDDPRAVLPAAPVVTPLRADRAGYLVEVEAEEIGRASVDLGAGRHRKGDAIDPAVGVVFHSKIGDRLDRSQEIGQIHAREDAGAAAAGRRVLAALSFGDDPVEPPPLIHGWHGGANAGESPE
jgi:thymidine phosphorylase